MQGKNLQEAEIFRMLMSSDMLIHSSHLSFHVPRSHYLEDGTSDVSEPGAPSPYANCVGNESSVGIMLPERSYTTY